METPYYAVIFTSKRTPDYANTYAEMAEKMETLARTQPGFLGVDSARNDIGITVSYWKSLADIAHWKQNFEHQLAQKQGRNIWYSYYNVKICKVEREYTFEKTS